MARPIRNDIDYFPHPVNHGKKMFFIRQRYGAEGYAVWFMLLEELGKSNFHFLDLQSEVEFLYLSANFGVSENLILEIIELLVKLEEFDAELWREKILWNQKFTDSIKDAYKKRSNEVITKSELIEFLEAKGRIKPDKLRPKPGIIEPIAPKNPKRTLPTDPTEDSERVKLATRTIGEFFGVTELRNPAAFMRIGNFVRYQEAQGNLDYLAEQFTAYKAVKSKDPKFRHKWENYIGDPSEAYENGAWNVQDWTKAPELSQQDRQPTTDSKDFGAMRARTLQAQQEA